MGALDALGISNFHAKVPILKQKFCPSFKCLMTNVSTCLSMSRQAELSLRQQKDEQECFGYSKLIMPAKVYA
jgi:hypothetical protein